MRCATTVRRPLAAALVAALALVLGACGEEGGGEPARVAPARAAVWIEAVIDPQGEQEQAVRSILRRFPKGDQVPAMIAEAIEQEARSEKTPIDFEKDVKPWLGDRAGLFLIPVGRGEPKVGVIVATTDEGKARELLDKAAKDDDPKRRSYKGVDYTVTDEGAQGIVEGFVVGADEPELKRVVDAAQGSGLADSDRYKKAVEDLPEDRVATVFVDQKALAEASARGTQEAEISRRLLGGAAGQPLAAAVRAEPDAVAADSALAGQGGPLSGFLGSGPGLLHSLLADSWLALG